MKKFLLALTFVPFVACGPQSNLDQSTIAAAPNEAKTITVDTKSFAELLVTSSDYAHYKELLLDFQRNTDKEMRQVRLDEYDSFAKYHLTIVKTLIFNLGKTLRAQGLLDESQFGHLDLLLDRVSILDISAGFSRNKQNFNFNVYTADIAEPNQPLKFNLDFQIVLQKLTNNEITPETTGYIELSYSNSNDINKAKMDLEQARAAKVTVFRTDRVYLKFN